MVSSGYDLLELEFTFPTDHAMSEIVKIMKLHIHVNETEAKSLEELTACYAQACTFISKYVFDHGFILNFMKLQETLYPVRQLEPNLD